MTMNDFLVPFVCDEDEGEIILTRSVLGLCPNDLGTEVTHGRCSPRWRSRVAVHPHNLRRSSAEMITLLSSIEDCASLYFRKQVSRPHCAFIQREGRDRSELAAWKRHGQLGSEIGEVGLPQY